MDRVRSRTPSKNHSRGHSHADDLSIKSTPVIIQEPSEKKTREPLTRSKSKKADIFQDVDSYLGAVQGQMKDIKSENTELKKMLKEMY